MSIDLFLVHVTSTSRNSHQAKLRINIHVFLLLCKLRWIYHPQVYLRESVGVIRGIMSLVSVWDCLFIMFLAGDGLAELCQNYQIIHISR